MSIMMATAPPGVPRQISRESPSRKTQGVKKGRRHSDVIVPTAVELKKLNKPRRPSLPILDEEIDLINSNRGSIRQLPKQVSEDIGPVKSYDTINGTREEHTASLRVILDDTKLAPHEQARRLKVFLESLSSKERTQLVNERFRAENYSGPYSHPTPLAVSILKDSPPLVLTLLQFLADPGAQPCVVCDKEIDRVGMVVNHLHLALKQFSKAEVVEHILSWSQHQIATDQAQHPEDAQHPTCPLPAGQSYSLLEYAVKCPDHALVKELLRCVHDVNVRSGKEGHRRSALQLAIRQGNMYLVQELLKMGADAGCTDLSGKTALMYAAEKGETTIVEQILSASGSTSRVVSQDCAGKTALHYAASHCDPGILAALLKAGCDAGIKNNAGFGPLDVTVRANPKAKGVDPELLGTSRAQAIEELLVARNAPKVYSVETVSAVIFYLLRHGTLQKEYVLLEFMFKNREQLTQCDIGGSTVMHAAAQCGRVNVLGWVLRDGSFTVEAEDRQGWQAIHRAAAKGKAQSIALLLKFGARLDAVGALGYTPLFLLLRHGHTSLAIALLTDIHTSGLDHLLSLASLRKLGSEVPLPASLEEDEEQSKSSRKSLVAVMREAATSNLTLMDLALQMRYKTVVPVLASLRITHSVDLKNLRYDSGERFVPDNLQGILTDLKRESGDKAVDIKPLQYRCRDVIRRAMGKDIVKKTNSLSLVKDMKDYICLRRVAPPRKPDSQHA